MHTVDVRIGMRVVPHAKTSPQWPGLRTSAAWKEGKEQGFLYVVHKLHPNCGEWALSERADGSGDFFMAADFDPCSSEEFVSDIDTIIAVEMSNLFKG